jgi:hypothetical protein
MRTLTALRCAAALAALWALSGHAALAQDAPAPAASPAVPQTSASVKVPAGTVVDIAIDEALSGSASHEGQTFRLHLAQPIVIDGLTVVPAGTEGAGEVIEAKGPGLAGRPGVLIIAARYLEFSGARIPLGHLRYGQTGHDNTGASMAVQIAVGLPGVLITGGDVKAPVGMAASARVTSDVVLPDAPAASAAPNPDQTKQGTSP